MVDQFLIITALFLLACSDHVARLWHAEQSHVVREYQGHQKAIVALAYDDRH